MCENIATCSVTVHQKMKLSSMCQQQGEHGLDEHKLHVFLSALQSLIPPLFAVVLQNAPFTSRAILHGDIPAIEGRITIRKHKSHKQMW